MTNPSPISHIYAHPAEWYDQIYTAQGKDYAAEVDVVAGIIRRCMPSVRTVLDVGCGTGLHLEALAEQFDRAVGVDLSPAFVEHVCGMGLDARVGDMRALELGEQFDAVTSLFSAVGHVGDEAGLDAAIASMARHVAPGGVLVVEPWFSPDVWRVGHHGIEIADMPTSSLVRVNWTSREQDTSIVHFAWSQVDENGITRLDEELRLALFTPEQYCGAFERAGLVTSFDPAGCNDGGRGLWIGVRQ